jgi:hypothetical protein
VGNNNSIVNIDAKGLSKVGAALVDKVAEGIGGIFKPTQIVREARAQAKADLITAQSQIEIDELQRRAMQRFVAEEAKRQSNIEAITKQAIPLLDDMAQPGQMNDDWVANFFEKSRIVSDDDMQSLWSKVLAGESNSPGKYSKRTVNLLSDLDKSDAELFSNFCGFAWALAGLKPLIYFENDGAEPGRPEIYAQHNINFDTLSHLEALGLITHTAIGGFATRGLPKTFSTAYHGRHLTLEMPNEGMPIEIGSALFTNAGAQLAEICGSKPIAGFYDFVEERFKAKGFMVVP